MTDELSWGTTTDWENATTSNIEVNGSSVQLASAIPDSGDLHARYDFSQEDGALPITDQTGNGYDLTNGSYSGVSSSINGVQAGDFDGSDDRVYETTTNINQPTTIFLVIEPRIDNSEQDWFDGNESASHLIRNNGGGGYGLFAGSNTGRGGTPDTQPHIISAVFDGNSSVLRVDGTEVSSGDAGSHELNGVTLGSRGGGSDYADVAYGAALIYPMDKTNILSDVESYLGDKWGVTL